MALIISLRPAVPDDAPALAAIEAESFPGDACWRAQDFLRYETTVAEIQEETRARSLAGFLVSRQTFPGSSDAPPEREILNVAVTAKYRRLGVAKCLLVNEAKRGASLFLEVRTSNVSAIQLYKNAGFTAVATRRNYYDNPVESAIVMSMK